MKGLSGSRGRILLFSEMSVSGVLILDRLVVRIV